MNLTNTVFEFASEVIASAGEDDALFEADAQESDADPVKMTKTVRVGSAVSQPDLTGGGIVKEFNGQLAIECLVKPDSQSLADRAAARETAHKMAMELAKAILLDPELNNRSCLAQVTGKQDGYRNIKTARYQVSVISLLINQR